MPESSPQPSGLVTREKLIEAAGVIFAEKGLHGARIRDITQRAEANVAAVNYHFRDKFELYALILRQVHESLLEGVNQPLHAATPDGRLRELLGNMLASALDPARPAWHTVLLGRELFEPTPALDALRDLMQVPANALRTTIQEMRPDLSAQQAILAACSIIAQCLFYVHHRHLARRLFPSLPDPPVSTLIEQVTAFSVAALRGIYDGAEHTAVPAKRRAHTKSVTRPRKRRQGAG